MSKVMVIGAAGWLGMRLVDRLILDERKIIGVDINTKGIKDNHHNLETINADIRDLEKFSGKLKECVAVFNCAGLQHPKLTRDMYAVNALAPARIFKACSENGVKTFVHISSVVAHGENENNTAFIKEEDPLKPIIHYGKSKARGETLLKSCAKTSTRLIILRPGVFYGKSPSKNLRALLEKMKKSAMPIFSRQGFLRTYVDVEKVVEAMILSEEKGISGESYLIGDIEPLSTRKFYRILDEELGVPLKIIRVPVFVSRMAQWSATAAGNMGVHIPIANIVGEFGRHSFLSPKKAMAELSFQPHLSSENGLREMVRSVYKYR